MDSIEHIFVYGTLKTSMGAARFPTEYVCEASINGFTIHDLGWFPGIRHSGKDSDVVHGELHALPSKTPDLLDRLDKYEGEGHLYLREVVDVELDPGVYVKAWVYVYNHEPQNAAIIGGVWPAYRGAGGHSVQRS